MRVALIDPSLFSLKYDLELGDALVSAGCEVVLHGRRVRPEEEGIEGSLRPSGIFYGTAERLRRHLPNSLLLPMKGLAHVSGSAAIVREIRARPSVVHYQWSAVPFIDRFAITAVRRYAPVVMTVHNTTIFHGDPSSRLQAWGWPGVLHLADALVVHTEFSASQLLSTGLPSDRIHVIPHGHRTEDSKPAKPSGFRELLMIGLIRHYKGVDIAIRALAKLPEPLRDTVRLKIAGLPRNDITPYKSLAQDLGVSKYIEWDLRFIPEKEMGEMVARSFAMLLPYREIDGSGILAAALGAGKPVIASRVGGFEEQVVDGVNGRTVPAEDSAALAAAITDLLNAPDRAEEMGRRAQEMAGKERSWSAVATKTIELYESAAERFSRCCSRSGAEWRVSSAASDSSPEYSGSAASGQQRLGAVQRRVAGRS